MKFGFSRCCPKLREWFLVFPVLLLNTGKAFLVFLFPSQNAKIDSRSCLGETTEAGSYFDHSAVRATPSSHDFHNMNHIFFKIFFCQYVRTKYIYIKVYFSESLRSFNKIRGNTNLNCFKTFDLIILFFLFLVCR